MFIPSLSQWQLLWPLQRFKDSRGQHLLQREALNYGLDLEPPSLSPSSSSSPLPPQRYEQDEPVRVLTKELHHTEAGRILAAPSQHLQQSHLEQHREPLEEADNVPPHMPHARWETATTVTLPPTSTSSSSRTSSRNMEEAEQDYVYSWQVGEWSKCSQECGAAGSGLQVSAKKLGKRQENGIYKKDNNNN